jgi:hypothetical protein
VKSTETASAPAEPRRHTILPASREKAAAKTTAPAPAASSTAAAETAAVPSASEDHRDANDLARAAIERLRDSQSRTQDNPHKGQDNNKSQDNKTQEASRAAETPRLQEAPRSVASTPAQTASIRPLPPPITVATPPADAPANTASIRSDDPSRPTPPAEIPPPPPIDLRADASKLATRTNNMAQDMLHAAKSMFHAVLPNSDQQQSSSSPSQFTD